MILYQVYKQRVVEESNQISRSTPKSRTSWQVKKQSQWWSRKENRAQKEEKSELILKHRIKKGEL